MRYTAEEIDALLARGESGTDWGAVKGTTAQELEASIAADPDDVHEPIPRPSTDELRPFLDAEIDLERTSCVMLAWCRAVT